jgi:hypothetical protein
MDDSKQSPPSNDSAASGKPCKKVRPICHNYPIDQILRERDRLTAILRHECEGREVKGALFQQVVAILCEELPASVHYPTLYDSLRGLLGTFPTAKSLGDLSHRLAGNLENLKARRVVTAWTLQRHWEWVPLSIVRVRRARSTVGRIGAIVTFKVLAGTPCPLLIERFWSLRQCAYMARHMGFSRPAPPRARTPAPYPYSAPEQLVTMRLYGLIDPHKSSPAVGPVFDKVRFPQSLLSFNREQLKHRNRGKGYACPKGFPLTVLCHHCFVGYDNCRAGCHPRTYETRECPGCKKEAPFDPDAHGPHCVNCVIRAAYTKEGT